MSDGVELPRAGRHDVAAAALGAAGIQPLTAFCRACAETVTTWDDGRCVWCGTDTEAPVAPRRPRPELLEGRSNAKMTRRQVEAAYTLYQRGRSMGEIAELIWRRFGYKDAKTCAGALAHSFKIAGFPARDPAARAATSLRKVSDELVDEAWRRYQAGEQLPAIAQDLFARGGTGHGCWQRLYECVIRQFRRRGYPLRTRAENLQGRACRTEKHCQALNNRGRPCGANVIKRDDGTYADYCWQHDESYAENREAISHLERMRARRRWMKELVPMAPFVAWLERRRAELDAACRASGAPPRRSKRGITYGGLRELSRRTGVDQSTLARWMEFRSTKGPKHSITETKVREVLDRDSTTSFDELYRAADTEAIAA